MHVRLCGDQRARSRRVLCPLLALLLSLTACTAMPAGRALSTPTLAPTPSPTAPANWQTYRDPQGIFAIRFPPSWAVKESDSHASFGSRTGSYSFIQEDVGLGDAARLTGEFYGNEYYVFLDVVPLTTDFARQWYCQFPRANTTLGGVPAYTKDGRWMWYIEAHDAHFQINVIYPNGPDGRQSVAMALGSITLTNPGPLTC